MRFGLSSKDHRAAKFFIEVSKWDSQTRLKIAKSTLSFMRFPFFSTPLSKKSSQVVTTKKIARKRTLIDCTSGIERLEARIAPAATVKVANQDIFISGDGANNGISVFEDGAGRLFIYGNAATAINGDGVVSGVILDTNAGGGREFDNGLFKNIYINMGAGNDDVEIAGIRSGDVSILSINTGNSTTGDVISVAQSTFAGNPDTVFGVNATSGPVTIIAGNGPNSISVNALTAPSLSILTGTGADTINIAKTDDVSVNSGNFLIDAGDGANAVAFGPNHNTIVSGQLNLHTGAGSDNVAIDSLTANSLVVQTGAGTDTVTMTANTPNTIHGDVTLGGGAGAKTFTVGSANQKFTTVDGSFSIVSNGDTNSITIDALKAGNVLGSLSISAPTGNATITLASLSGDTVTNGDVSIDTGDLNTANTVSIGSGHSLSVSGNVSVHTGAGSDSVSLDSLTANGLNVNTGAGSDSVNVAQSAGVTIHGDTFLQGGAGSKTILVGSASNPVSVDGNLNITTGSGNDSVTLNFLTVGAVKGNLTVSTDLGDDTVKLATTGDVVVPHGSATIDTGDATTIDSVTVGTTHSVTISGDLAIHTGSGDDAVILDSLTVGSTFGSLTINTGVGDDTITIAGSANVSVPNGSVFIDTGDGVSDTVLVGAGHTVTIAQDLSIHTGDGNDTVTVDQVTTRNLDIHTNGGSDTVTVAGVNAVTVYGSATIDTGDATAGGDIVHIGGGAGVSFNSSLAVTLGNGDDTFSLDNLTSTGAVSINGGAGNNTISIGSVAAVSVTNLLAVQTGAGNDSVNTSGLTAGSLAINTGLGVDAASLQHLTVSGTASVLVADHDHTLALAGQAFSDVSISAGASHATIALGAGIHKTKEIGPDLKDFPIKHLTDSIGITFAPRAAESRDATLRLTDNSLQHHQVTFRLEGYSPVSIDLTPTIKKIALPKTPIAAGSTKKITVPIVIANAGNTAVPKGSKVDVQIYVHNTGTNADTLITTLSDVSVSALAAGKSKALKHAIAMPDSLVAGIYEVMVNIVDVSPFHETSILNNSITSSQTFSVM